MRTQLAVIQATPFCNIRCKYCYLPGRSETEAISHDTVRAIAKQLCGSRFVRERLTVVWHAGEPLRMPTAFYRSAFETFLSQPWQDVDLSFSIQTNAMMLNQSWCELFREYDVKVGVSLDGPAELHDQNRIDRAGRGTFSKGLRGLQVLLDAGLSPSVIAVVPKTSLPHAAAFWQFFADLGISVVGLNPEEAEGIHRYSSVHNDACERDYRTFLETILSMGVGEGGYPRLREYDAFTEQMRMPAGLQTRAHDNVPMAILNFDYQGGVSTFSPELLTAIHAPYGNFVFGNVHTDSLDSILTNEKFLSVNTAIQSGVAHCQATCDYFRFCGGGSPSNKIAEAGRFDVTETRSCRLRVKIPVSAFVRAALELGDAADCRDGDGDGTT